MPIADCGFPPANLVPGTGVGTVAPKFIRGLDALILQGPTTMVEIGFDPGLFHADPVKVQAAMAAVHAPSPVRQLVGALIDTGARESCIDEELAKQLQLPLIDRVDGSGIGGTEKFDVYLGHIRIAALNFLEYGRFLGVKLQAGNQPHRALLGRTLFRSMILVYDGRDGTARLAV